MGRILPQLRSGAVSSTEADPTGRPPLGAAAFLAAGLTVALVGAVALASRHPLAAERARSGVRGGGSGWLPDLVTAAMLFCLGFGLVVYVAALNPAGRKPVTSRSRFATLIALVVAVLLLVELQVRFHLIHVGRPVQRGQAQPLAPAPRAVPLGRVASHGGHLPWPVLLALVVAGIAAAVALIGPALLPRWRSSFVPPEEVSWREEIVARVAWDSIDDLLREPDPRRAVIAAYARMERCLELAGIPRGRSDTPAEYLAKAFAGLPAGMEAATRLTALYVEARFSPHSVPEQTRARAVDALRELATGLETPV